MTQEALKLVLQTLELSKETMESARKQIDELKAENKALKEALAQPPQRTEQEPVIDKSAATRIATSLGWSPQRTWIELTDDEFNELYDRYVPLTCYALLIEKVEAKFKEKNGFAEQKNSNTRETTYINYDSV
jgi:hypothetical protein